MSVYPPGHPYYRDGGSDWLSVYNVPPHNVQRTLLQFDLSALPTGGTIQSATMTLFARPWGFYYNPNQLPMDIFRVIVPWEEMETAWDLASTGNPWNPGAEGAFVGTDGVAGGTPYATSNVNPDHDGQPITWDLTQLVSEWYGGTHSNYGLMLLSQPENYAHFYSREYDVTEFTPRLEVTVNPVPAPSTLVGLVSIGLVGAIGYAGRRRKRAA